ncbi:DUF4434 domain-containing protein [Jeongeupia naejangsanensis]|uniref:DUF4434 domain-containing protein n=1 Tax=Jeongeupia naejangsanensis TaxID=613195 RepID=A0ABS2BIU5_9NEIS|nr:DUF4434 domain-containing protein [Jeongeupia naejangsanensis]MBM3114754.1 DUF4434 domain-containing protein [Jeongeupia naejangsanensis]
MRRRWTGLLLAVLLALPVMAKAMTAIVYQPQLRDRDVPAASWPHIFGVARAQGFDTLVVQWTRHGEGGFTAAADQDWLAARFADANAAGLKLILGLNSDPDFYIRQQQSARTLTSYLRRLSRDDLNLAKLWAGRLDPALIQGWYLPAEIDDVQWREADTYDVLTNHLSNQVRQLRKVLDRPVYASSFFVGNMAPQTYARMLGQLEQESGVRLWVQDGAGTGKLNVAERQVYLDAVSNVHADCQKPASRGVVFELFVQTGDDTAFRAEPRPLDEARHILAKRAECGRDSVFFSLRYLPALNGALPY